MHFVDFPLLLRISKFLLRIHASILEREARDRKRIVLRIIRHCIFKISSLESGIHIVLIGADDVEIWVLEEIHINLLRRLIHINVRKFSSFIEHNISRIVF